MKRIVDTSFWEDDKIVEFSPEDKYFMLYILTNPHSSQLGIYKFVPKTVAFELGWSTDTVTALIERFENKHHIIKYNNTTKEIAIKNYLVYSIIKGGKPVEDLLIKELAQVKDKKLIYFVFGHLLKEKKESLNATVEKIINYYSYQNDNDNDNDNDVSYNDSYNDSSTAPFSPVVFLLPLIDNTYYEVTDDMVKEWGEVYTAVDIIFELGKMKCWLNANPRNKKTRKGAPRFINSWLSRCQDRAPRITHLVNNTGGGSSTYTTTPGADLIDEGLLAQLKEALGD